MPSGKIIFLNGASSAGKSTLSKSVQRLIDEPFGHVSSDQFVDAHMLPQRRGEGGDFAWPVMRPKFFTAFHRCLPAIASAENNMIVEHVIDMSRGCRSLSTFSHRLMSFSWACIVPCPNWNGANGHVATGRLARRGITLKWSTPLARMIMKLTQRQCHQKKMHNGLLRRGVSDQRRTPFNRWRTRSLRVLSVSNPSYETRCQTPTAAAELTFSVHLLPRRSISSRMRSTVSSTVRSELSNQ